MQRIRVKYGKTNLGKFISHLDILRTWGRIIRRAEIPIAYSEGFNPHPKISFGSALAVGVTSDGEYLDLELKEKMDVAEILRGLKESVPSGIFIFDVQEVDPKLPSLMSVIDTAIYMVKANLSEERNVEVEQEIKKVMDMGEVEIIRDGKKGPKPKDIRAGIHNLEATIIDGSIYFRMTVDSGSSNNIRPEEVVQAITKYSSLPIDEELLEIHRIGLFIKKDDKLITPME